jgi:predicted DNA-binding protein YlxM (UPF0122 family)
MIKHDRINQLLDFYKPLLTQHQQAIAELHYAEDLSITEITEHTQSSRAAVHETLKRVETVLEDYETALQLVSKHQQRQTLLLQLKQLNHPTVNEIIAKLDDLD